MARCTRKGCGRTFDENAQESCVYHPGGPVFHEGLKSWSCCSDVNKPVLDFDEFMKVPGCTEVSGHTTNVPKVEAPTPSASTSFTSVSSVDLDGKETYGSNVHKPPASSFLTTLSPERHETPVPLVEEEDDLNVAVKPGTLCRRKGCGVSFISDEINRKDDGEGTICTYHPLQPIFREGSKGYLCCKRRVLEFEEFLKIKGCKTGRHVFIPRVRESEGEETVNCRIDHYQTPGEVHVSVFAKQVNKELSKVNFEDTQVTLNLYLPGKKRFFRVLNLFGPIDPTKSTFKIMGTKVELLLYKRDTRSWTVLEQTNRDLGPISLTFGVGGRTGTVGGKEIILDDSNKAR
ncbi:HSP20-like chaperone [Crucibulum laeve]|uniref:HSP20-like chaperone n=1 Tax=Crucibulum laeve TaxID=68775 RepID=A0A5C3MFS3_9AGAR|nr:HSP20-like chaperone [Crucibulum laeve]